MCLKLLNFTTIKSLELIGSENQKISVGKILFEKDFPQESVGFIKDC